MRATKQQPQSSEEESFIGRKWTFYLALIIVVVVVVGGVIAVVINRSKTDEPTPQPQPGTTIAPQQDRSDWDCRTSTNSASGSKYHRIRTVSLSIRIVPANRTGARLITQHFRLPG